MEFASYNKTILTLTMKKLTVLCAAPEKDLYCSLVQLLPSLQFFSYS